MKLYDYILLLLVFQKLLLQLLILFYLLLKEDLVERGKCLFRKEPT